MRWLTVVLHRMIGFHAESSVPIIYLDDDQSTNALLVDVPVGPCLIVSHYPRTNLIEYLAAEAWPVFLAIDDPRRCTIQHLQAGYSDFFDATRAVTKSLALLAAAAGLVDRVILFHRHLEQKADIFIELLARSIFKIAADDALRMTTDLVTNAEGSICDNATALFRPAGLSDPELTADEEQQIEWVTAGILKKIAGMQGAKTTWPYSFFSEGDFQKSPPAMIQDMLGRARCLFFGPHLYLPQGQWQGEVRIGLSNEVVDTHIRVEVSAQRVIADFVTRATRGGLFAVPIRFEVQDARMAIEVRIFIDRGEIEGRLGLQSVLLWEDQTR